jgi:peroxidase
MPKHCPIYNSLSRFKNFVCQQESRRILIAEFQHIVYSEWLTVLLGPKLMASLSLVPLSDGFTNNYRDSVNPSIVNAFAAAAGRQHNLIPSLIK